MHENAHEMYGNQNYLVIFYDIQKGVSLESLLITSFYISLPKKGIS